MRILQVSSAKTYGGGERHLVDLSRSLQEKGHEIFVALRPTNEWQGRLDFIPPGNFLHVSIRNSFGMFSAKRISRFLIKNKIDIIHAHVARDYLAASIAGRIAQDTKIVLTRHVLFSMKPFHRFALRNVDAAIAVSEGVRQQLLNIFPDRKITVIPNGLVMHTTDERERLGSEFRELHHIPLDAPLVGTVGELVPLKGQRDFVLAAHEIVKVIPDCRFVVAGKDNTIDQRFRRELKRLVKVFDMAENFLWLDWVEDLTPLLSSLDVFVSPSHSESFGLAILEAMANHAAVIATSTLGAEDLLSDSSLLVPVRDPLAMANAVVALVGDRERCRETGLWLGNSARERFSLDRMVSATESLYERVASQTSY
ncbi:MAG: glycosyltransferase family 4 protein [Acidobacteria bacterium]|nr:glycosyltransferase family 4 protein [Acidobacteriota bacterium]